MSLNPMVQFVNTGKETLFGIMEASREKAHQSLEAVKAIASQAKEVVTANGNKVALAVGSAILVGAPNRAMAADPAWFTTVTTELGNIPTMIGTVIVAAVGIYMAPIAWAKIKHAIGRA